MLKENSYRVFQMVYFKVICVHLIHTSYKGIFNFKVLLTRHCYESYLHYHIWVNVFQIFSFCLKRRVVTKQYMMNRHSRESYSCDFVLNCSALITQIVYLDEHTAWLREWNHRFYRKFKDKCNDERAKVGFDCNRDKMTIEKSVLSE